MFQDEARFGRVSDTRRCWCPKPIRPLCQAMITQEYVYAYAAVSVADGELDTLILPQVNSNCMQIFLDEVASRHPSDRIIIHHKVKTTGFSRSALAARICHTGGVAWIIDMEVIRFIRLNIILYG